MARAREPGDWAHDREAARSSEERVATALHAHPLISHITDYTAEFDEPDFRFRLDGKDVRLEVKAKGQTYTADYEELWPEVAPADLFILDETSYRNLVWGEGLGFVVVDDRPASRWHVLGPWELCLGPRRRFERRGDRGAGEFKKGKLLLDLRTAAATTPELSIDALITAVRASRRDLSRVEAVHIRAREQLPLVPRDLESTVVSAHEDPSPLPAATVEVDGDPAWCGLSARLVDGVKRRVGWDGPTEAQRLAIPPILVGHNVLLLAPTAGGKTEAGLLPLLDRVSANGDGGLAILAVSPLKALLDDQLPRHQLLAGLIGGTAFAWHGDVPWELKRDFLDSPSTILLTTPESLEVLLASPRHDHRRLFSGLGAVVVDEVHAFVGTPRGAQLASLLERIDRFAETDLHRVGLSATVGAPEDVLGWLRGGSLRESSVVRSQPKLRGEQLRVQSYGHLPDAISTIGSVIDGATSLVFTPSRRRAEELANGLGVPVHHSSVAPEGRAEAVRMLRSGFVRSVVATSSLEMGIDLGELDLVVHDGAPSGPGSYLQRLGRGGRRTGLRRLVFTTGQADDLLLILGVLARVRRGDLEELPPRRGARLILGQQALALATERTVVRRRELGDALRWAPTFSASGGDIEATINHLLAEGWLVQVEDSLVPGARANARFTGQRLGDLAVNFEGGSGARVVDQAGNRVGQVDWTQMEEDSLARRDRSIVLAGRTWEVLTVDRATGSVVVRPGDKGRPISWRGQAVEVDRRTWEAVREVLLTTEVPLAMDERAEAWLNSSRSRWAPRLDHPVRQVGAEVVVDSFAGAAAHRATLSALAADGQAEGTTCTLTGALYELRERAAAALENLETVIDTEAQRVAPTLNVRHRELLPASVIVAEAREYHVDVDGLQKVLSLLASATSH